MKKLTMITRYLLGVIFFVFGLNGFFNFIPMQAMPEAAGTFLGALAATGYFFPVLKFTEVVCGALLLFNRAVPLAIIVLSPIVIQIFLFHALLTPPEMTIMPIIIVACMIIQGRAHWATFKPLFKHHCGTNNHTHKIAA